MLCRVVQTASPWDVLARNNSQLFDLCTFGYTFKLVGQNVSTSPPSPMIFAACDVSNVHNEYFSTPEMPEIQQLSNLSELPSSIVKFVAASRQAITSKWCFVWWVSVTIKILNGACQIYPIKFESREPVMMDLSCLQNFTIDCIRF